MGMLKPAEEASEASEKPPVRATFGHLAQTQPLLGEDWTKRGARGKMIAALP